MESQFKSYNEKLLRKDQDIKGLIDKINDGNNTI